MRLSWSEDGRTSGRTRSPSRCARPGDDFDLVAGFLHGEGVVTRREQLAEITYCRGVGEPGVQRRRGEAGARASFPDLERLKRNFYTTSSCGVCGKASLEAVEAQGCEPLPPGPRLDSGLLPELPDRLREAQAVFERTGGLHAAGLFGASGEPWIVREDVGRHNAVDKVLGRALLDGRLPAHDSVLVVSGRASFELVQKALVAGVPAMVAVGAPSSLAVDLARRFGQTLVGFARDGGFNVYCGEGRLA